MRLKYDTVFDSLLLTHTGPLFGVLTRSMNTKSIRKYINLPHKMGVIEALMAVEGASFVLIFSVGCHAISLN